MRDTITLTETELAVIELSLLKHSTLIGLNRGISKATGSYVNPGGVSAIGVRP